MAEQCFICGRGDTLFKKEKEDYDYRCQCRRCGSYRVTGEFVEDKRNLSGDQRLRLTAAIRRATDQHGSLREKITRSNYEELIARSPIPHALEQVDMFIEAIALGSRYPSPTVVDNIEAWAARLFFTNQYGLLQLVGDLETEQWVKPHTEAFSNDGGPSPVQYSLTLKGWERAREIRKVRGPGNQAFVAMWFHTDMDGVYRDGFEPALRDSGYQPYKVDVAPHDNRIDDEIHAEIRRSKILVADATGVRPSVYYEAGLARGLGLKVIWCCNSTYRAYGLKKLAPNMPKAPRATKVPEWFSIAAFDTNHEVFLFWKDPADLREKLVMRIRALDLDLPITSGARV